jgi:hypothetical protein
MVPVSTIIKDKVGNNQAKYFFTKNPDYQQYSQLKIELPVPVLDNQGNLIGSELKEQTFYAEGNDRDKLFAVLENDVEMTPDLEGIDDDLEKLGAVLDSIFHDITLTKKKIYFVFPQDPDKDDWDKVTAM